MYLRNPGCQNVKPLCILLQQGSSVQDVCTEGGKAQCRQKWRRGSIFTVFLWRALWMTPKGDGDGNSQNSLRRAKLQSNRRH